MLKHIVLWKLKDFANGNSKEQNKEIIKRELLELKNYIQEIVSIEVGFNVIKSNQSYDVCLYSEFRNETDLLIYQQHEMHQKFALFMNDVVEARVVIDYIV
jgi:hypothetical protein